MNILGTNNIRLTLSAQLALLLVVSILLWSVGAPVLFQRAHAANLTVVSDTLSSSNLGTLSKHFIQFTNATSTIAGQTIKIQFDPVGSAFTEAFSAATTTDFNATGFTLVANAAGCTAAPSEAYPTGNYNNGTDENITFTVCPTDTIAPGPITIGIGTSTRLITNPAAAGSYRIFISGTQDNQGETRVFVLQNVTLTASVNTSFTFTVSGLATSSALAGLSTSATSTASSTATALPFGTLASSTIASSTVLAQQLNVTTNARNGFSVTVQENQPPTSSTGATIDLFSNGASTTIPIAWVAPTAILDVPSTYGHFGVTSDDDEAANEFGNGTLWAGNIDLPRQVFSHTGPSDGVTQNKGKARVAYRIQISDLQEAGTDYNNTITYVATPTF